MYKNFNKIFKIYSASLIIIKALGGIAFGLEHNSHSTNSPEEQLESLFDYREKQREDLRNFCEVRDAPPLPCCGLRLNPPLNTLFNPLSCSQNDSPDSSCEIPTTAPFEGAQTGVYYHNSTNWPDYPKLLVPDSNNTVTIEHSNHACFYIKQGTDFTLPYNIKINNVCQLSIAPNKTVNIPKDYFIELDGQESELIIYGTLKIEGKIILGCNNDSFSEPQVIFQKYSTLHSCHNMIMKNIDGNIYLECPSANSPNPTAIKIHPTTDIIIDGTTLTIDNVIRFEGNMKLINGANFNGQGWLMREGSREVIYGQPINSDYSDEEEVQDK